MAVLEARVMHPTLPPDAPHSTLPAPASLALTHARQGLARAQALRAPACAGLHRALAQAPMVVVCAVGTAHEAALMAQSCYSAVAQLPVWVLHPDELAAMGAGLWRLTQLLVVSFGKGAPASDVAACHSAMGVAQSYHCPVLALVAEPAPPLPRTAAGRAPWRLPTFDPPDATHGAFALPYLGHLALALAAAQARMPKFVAPPALEEALQAYPTRAEQHAALWAADGAHRALAQSCTQSPRLRLATTQRRLVPALRALAGVKLEIDVVVLGEAARPCPPGTVQLHISASAQALQVFVGQETTPAVTAPLPTTHEALGGLWAHLYLDQLLTER